jgi:hypothetical protein
LVLDGATRREFRGREWQSVRPVTLVGMIYAVSPSGAPLCVFYERILEELSWQT